MACGMLSYDLKYAWDGCEYAAAIVFCGNFTPPLPATTHTHTHTQNARTRLYFIPKTTEPAFRFSSDCKFYLCRIFDKTERKKERQKERKKKKQEIKKKEKNILGLPLQCPPLFNGIKFNSLFLFLLVFAPDNNRIRSLEISNFQ